MNAYDTEEREARGKTWTIEWVHDEDHGAPWEECDGHGPVSVWERRNKLPGELVLVEDRGGRRFYDFAEAVRIARRDGWNTAPYNWPSKGAQAAAAAKADYEYLRGWCNDQWHYCGICVTLQGVEHEISASLWGIEAGLDSSDEYHEEVIDDLMAECLIELNRKTFAGCGVGL
jgi:hypothetical protein